MPTFGSGHVSGVIGREESEAIELEQVEGQESDCNEVFINAGRGGSRRNKVEVLVGRSGRRDTNCSDEKWRPGTVMY